MTMERMWALRNRIAEHVARPDVEGVVVTHGTDTLEESAYLCARSLERTKPIVFTGAMRAASDLGWDGPVNLTDAVRVAASDHARDYGTMVVISGRIFSGSDVTKSHTHLLDAFESPELGPLGVVDEGRVDLGRALAAAPTLHPASPALPIDIIAAYAGADARLIDACRSSGQGLVIAAMGRGNVPPLMSEGIGRWIAEGKPVVIASRAIRGRVGPTYGYPGGGRRLIELGAIFAGSCRPQQARIDLSLAIGAGLDMSQTRTLFDR
jgi:L-asparaginase